MPFKDRHKTSSLSPSVQGFNVRYRSKRNDTIRIDLPKKKSTAMNIAIRSIVGKAYSSMRPIIVRLDMIEVRRRIEGRGVPIKFAQPPVFISAQCFTKSLRAKKRINLPMDVWIPSPYRTEVTLEMSDIYRIESNDCDV